MVRFVENERNEFTKEIIEIAWEKANERCQNCGNDLIWKNQGREGKGCWEAHHKDGNPKNDKQENCQILCWPCHKKTLGEDTESGKKKIRLGIKVRRGKL